MKLDEFNRLTNREFYFADINFNLLMQRRIINVLVVCSEYDRFMLEEDGRIDEQIFHEYVSHNLRYPPEFIHASTANRAFEILSKETIDLIIIMLSVVDMDPFALSKRIKEAYPRKPIVVLTPFSREIALRVNKEDLSAIDYVFCWLGNADILLAIIKLLEDKMNVEYDAFQVGVQAILLVEDSIRFYSSYLPTMYKLLFKQSEEFMLEGLNEHQKMLRRRGRPKILMANNLDDALEIYQKYKNNLLGIISDISYPHQGQIDKEAGLKLCKIVRNEDELLPFILQSSDIEFEFMAKELKVGFINKNSKSLTHELKHYMIDYFAFGDFVFRNPENLMEIDRASDLQELQQKLLEVPDSTLEYHINRNHFSKWLNARAFFTIAEIFKPLRPSDFTDLFEIRKYLYDAIASYRLEKGRGVIGKFDRDRFDEYLLFSRIGENSIGGKARGLAFIDSLLNRNKLLKKYPNVIITIPRTIVMGTDIFDEFMESNKLYPVALSDLPDEEILQHFIKASLPFRIHADLLALISVIKNPIAVRSSSLLEDSHYQPFAGIYATYFVPKIPDDERKMLEQLSLAIKSVYASVFYKESKAYMAATSNLIDEEKMGIVLQEVCGNKYGEKFYPTLSGVARSINFYPIAPEKPEDGIANIALGLGKYIVDGGQTLRFSPKYPKKVIQLSSPEMAMRDSQKLFYAINLSKDAFVPSTDDGINILKLKTDEADADNSISQIASTFDYENHLLRDGVAYPGKRIITFSNILKYNTFPLCDILIDLLEIGQREMGTPVEIEFAANLETAKGCPKIFNFLQIRPIVEAKNNFSEDISNINNEKTIIYSYSALGNGVIDDVYDIIYVKPESFNPADNLKIAMDIETLNNKLLAEKRNYILIGPGRWGSSDHWLGIPVKWTQISGARLIIESGLDNYRIDPSQGTHFFQNLTSFHVGYFTINPYINDGYYDIDYLNNMDAVYEDKYIRHVKNNKPFIIKICGKKNLGLILKPV